MAREKRPVVKQVCPFCGSAFWAKRNRHYCSDECAQEARKRAKEKYFKTVYYPKNREKILKSIKEKKEEKKKNN